MTKKLQYGQRIKRKDDGTMGTIIKHFKTFGYGDNTYESYWVNWDDGHNGIPNESDFTVINTNQ